VTIAIGSNECEEVAGKRGDIEAGVLVDTSHRPRVGREYFNRETVAVCAGGSGGLGREMRVL